MVRIITILVCMLLCPAGAFAQGDSARVFTDKSPLIYEDASNMWPYSFVNEEGKPDGFNIDLIEMLLSELAIPYEIHIKSLPEVIGDMTSGRADLTFILEAGFGQKLGLFSRTVPMLFTQSVVTPKSKPLTIRSFRDLRNIKHQVTVNDSSLCHHIMLDYGWTDHAIVSSDMSQSIRALNDSQEGVIVWNTLSLKWLIHHYQLDNVVLTPVDMPHGEYRFLSNSQSLLDSIDQAYLDLCADGKLSALESKWLYPVREQPDEPVWKKAVAAMAVMLPVAILFCLMYIVRKNRQVEESNDRLTQSLAEICMSVQVHMGNSCYAGSKSEFSMEDFLRHKEQADRHIAKLKKDNSDRSLRYWSMFYSDEAGVFVFGTDGCIQNANYKAGLLFNCDIDKLVEQNTDINSLFHTTFNNLCDADGYKGCIKVGESTVRFQMKAAYNNNKVLLGIYVFCL